MICKKCGKDNKDRASVCVSCGEALVEETGKNPSLREKLLTTKNILIASGVAIVVLALVIGITIFLNSRPQKSVNDLYDAIVEYDYDKMAKLMPPAVIDSVKERMALDQTEMEIIDTKTLTPVYIAEIDEAYQQRFATPKGYIEDATIVYVEVKWKNEPLTRDRISVYMVKVGGEWYFDPLTTSEDFPFEELPVKTEAQN